MTKDLSDVWNMYDMHDTMDQAETPSFCLSTNGQNIMTTLNPNYALDLF